MITSPEPNDIEARLKRIEVTLDLVLRMAAETAQAVKFCEGHFEHPYGYCSICRKPFAMRQIGHGASMP